MSSDSQISYQLKLKNQLCCYIRLLDAINAELELRGNRGPVGTSISHLAKDLFLQMIEDPQITLYGPCYKPVCYVGLPVEYYGVKLLECNGDLIDQFHASFLVKKGGEVSFISDLVNPELELFVGRDYCDVNYSRAVCQLKKHFSYVREVLCHGLKQGKC
jgi:hypothetical protein